MNEEQFIQGLEQRSAEFSTLISQGSQWELKAHGIIFDVIEELTGKRPVVEFRLKLITGANTSCDFMAQHGDVCYAIEVKVESATNRGVFAGKSMQSAQEEDVAKLLTLNKSQFTVEFGDKYGQKTYFTPSQIKKWFVLIAYSPASCAKIQNDELPYPMTLYRRTNGIGVALLSL